MGAQAAAGRLEAARLPLPLTRQNRGGRVVQIERRMAGWDRATEAGIGRVGRRLEVAVSTGLGSGGWRTGGRVGLRGVWVVQQARVRSRGNLVIFEIFSLLPSQNEYYSDCNAQLKGV